MLDFEPVAKADFPRTIAALSEELDAYLYRTRTGVNIMEIRFPWKKVFAELKINPDDPNPDTKKILSYCEKQLIVWLDNRPRALMLDPMLAKELPIMLHGLLKKVGNAMKLQFLAAIYAERNKRKLDDESLAYLMEQIRMYVRQDEKHFYITGRGMQTVYRIADEKSRPTNVKFEPDAVVPGEQRIRRFSQAVKDLGLGYEEFRAAVRDLDGRAINVTLKTLTEWMAAKAAQHP